MGAVIPAGIGIGTLAAGAIIGGTVLNYKGQRQAAKAEEAAAERKQAAANKEAAYMEVQAGQAIASAQRDALEVQRTTRLLESRALAVAAASGAGASDTTVRNVIAGLSGEGAYRAQLALYEGKEKSRQLRVGAEIRREGGDLQAQYGRDAASAHRIASVGTLFSGAGTLAGIYGRSDPTSGNQIVYNE